MNNGLYGFPHPTDLAEFVSDLTALPSAGGRLDVPHGLPTQPRRFEAYLVNVNTEGDYVPNEIVPLPMRIITTGGGTPVYHDLAVGADATNCWLIWNSSSGTDKIYIPAKTDATNLDLTPANWKVRFFAWT